MNKLNIKTIPSNRLQYFPIMMFAVIMGFSGVAIIFEKAYQILHTPKILADIFLILDSIIFLLITTTYLLKIIFYKEEVKKELNHPIRINFFAASSISFLLLSIVYHNTNFTIATYLFFIGTAMQTFFTFYTISFWINKNLEITHSNPAWFIPIVGNVLVPVAGSGIIDKSFLMYYFSIGIFFWIILTSILINRIIFHNQLAAKFTPTLFIFIAPPSISFIAYIKMFDSYDAFAMILFNLSLFFTFLIIFMYKNFMKLEFFISWWAFTFPLAAVTLSCMIAYKITLNFSYFYLSFLLMFLTIFIVSIVCLKTIKHMLKKEICINE